MITPIAKTVVYRHRCRCDNANVAPAEGEAEEHRFDVDGEPFPWFITETGATFTRASLDLYLVGVTILVINPDDMYPAEFHHAPDSPALIAGREFPWAITGPVVYTYEYEKHIGCLSLSFLAGHVDTDGPIEPLREVGLAE